MLYAVKTSTEPEFSHGDPVPLFPVAPRDGTFDDVTTDGKRFLFAEPLEKPAPAIRVVQNWYEEFRKQQQGAR